MLTEDNDPKQKHDEMLLGGHRARASVAYDVLTWTFII